MAKNASTKKSTSAARTSAPESKGAPTRSQGGGARSKATPAKKGTKSAPRTARGRDAGQGGAGDDADQRIEPRASAAVAHEAARAQRAVDPELRDLPDEALDLLDDQIEDGELDDVRAAMAAPDGAVGRRVDGAEESHQLAAGDVDADASETGTGEEAVGGSTPTPDQDNVDEIGEALGVTYQPDEPLNTTEKIARRDDDRWELNPSSSEDFAERQNLEHAAPKRPPRAAAAAAGRRSRAR